MLIINYFLIFSSLVVKKLASLFSFVINKNSKTEGLSKLCNSFLTKVSPKYLQLAFWLGFQDFLFPLGFLSPTAWILGLMKMDTWILG